MIREVVTVQGRDVGIVIGVIVLVILLLALLGGGMMGSGMMGWGGYGTGFGWSGVVSTVLMSLLWVLVVGGVVFLVVWLLRQGRPAAAGPGPDARAIDILRQRYARGEITKEEFELMRRDLEA